MKPKLYQTTSGYDLLTSAGALYSIVKPGTGYAANFRGRPGTNFTPSGRLLKTIPSNLKRVFFTLQRA